MKKAKRAVDKKGGKYACVVCGLVLSVDESSGKADAAQTVCCGKKMKRK